MTLNEIFDAYSILELKTTRKILSLLYILINTDGIEFLSLKPWTNVDARTPIKSTANLPKITNIVIPSNLQQWCPIGTSK